MTDHVLDASAALALLLEEPGRDVVENALPGSAMSAVNLAEVVTSLINRGFPAPVARRTVARIKFDVVPLDAQLALDAGELREATRSLGLSLGDRCCLALARRLGVPPITADRRWADVDVGVEIRLIR